MRQFLAHYYDGVTAQRQTVRVTIQPGALTIHREGSQPVWWDLRDVRPGESSIDGGPVRIERIESSREVLLFDDRSIFDAIAAIDPASPFRRASKSRTSLAGKLLLLLLAAIAVTAVLYLWVLPAAGSMVAERIPVEMEEALGESVARQLTLFETICPDAVAQPVEEVTRRLAEQVPANPYRIRVRVTNGELVNAFAAPGGAIVVFRGLVEKTGSPEELAAVLAHELTHVTQRHGTKAMMRSIAVWSIVTFLTGDASGAAASLAAGLEQLRFSREQEMLADRGAMDLFEKAGIEPQAMIRMFRKLEREAPGLSKRLSYLSTHPDMGDRIREIERWAAERNYPTRRVLPGRPWPPDFKPCGDARR